MDCRPPGWSVHAILQAKILEWVAMPSSRESSQSRIELASLISPALAGGFFITSTIWESFVQPSAQSLQSCPTLCDPIDGNLPGSSVHWIFQARGLEWGAIAFSGSTFYTTSIQCTLFLSLIYGSRWALGKRILLFCGIRVGFLSHRAVWSRLPALSKGKAQSEYGNKLTH